MHVARVAAGVAICSHLDAPMKQFSVLATRCPSAVPCRALPAHLPCLFRMEDIFTVLEGSKSCESPVEVTSFLKSHRGCADLG